jgi:hypothetical protein
MGVRESAGLAQSSTAPHVDLSEMRHSRRSPFPGGRGHRYSSGRAGASRAAVPWCPAWEDDRSGGRCEILALPSRTRGRARPVEHKGDLSVLNAGVEERDHRTVAQAPGRDGLVENRRAPASGTAVYATTVFGSSANAPPSPQARTDVNGGDYPGRRDGWARASGYRVSGTARPSRTLPDQIDTTGPAPEAEQASATTPGRARSRRAGSTPSWEAAGLSTRSTSTPRVFDLALRTVTSISSVWTTAGRWLPWWARHVLSSCPARSRSPAPAS